MKKKYSIMIIGFFMFLILVSIFWINNYYKNEIDIREYQLREEINKLFSEENEIVIYPRTRYVEIKQRNTDGIGLGIKNLQQGVVGETTFSYHVSAFDVSNCGISEEVAESWIVVGKAEEDITIPIGGNVVRKVMFQTPIGSPLCIARYKLEVQADGSTYSSDFFDVRVLSQ